MLKPITGKGAGTPVKFQRSQEDNEKIAEPYRPQLPRDGSQDGRPTFKSGELPKGGYQSVWAFGDNPTDTKNSPTTKPGRKIY